MRPPPLRPGSCSPPLGATYPVAMDAQAKVASQYLVQALPVTYFLNRSGQVVGAALGPQSVTSLEHWVARLGVAG